MRESLATRRIYDFGSDVALSPSASTCLGVRALHERETIATLDLARRGSSRASATASARASPAPDAVRARARAAPRRPHRERSTSRSEIRGRSRATRSKARRVERPAHFAARASGVSHVSSDVDARSRLEPDRRDSERVDLQSTPSCAKRALRALDLTQPIDGDGGAVWNARRQTR